MKPSLLIPFSVLALFSASGFGGDPVGTLELRLALGDRDQEMRTTSINWPKVSGPVVKEVTEVPRPTAIPEALKKFRVMVDVGHGGHDLGAPGHYGVLEKNICLAIARQAKSRLERIAKLQDFPIEVKLSRETDTFISLRDRVKQANQWGADLFISIHANSSPVERARGFEVYFLANE